MAFCWLLGVPDVVDPGRASIITWPGDEEMRMIFFFFSFRVDPIIFVPLCINNPGGKFEYYHFDRWARHHFIPHKDLALEYPTVLHLSPVNLNPKSHFYLKKKSPVSKLEFKLLRWAWRSGCPPGRPDAAEDWCRSIECRRERWPPGWTDLHRLNNLAKKFGNIWEWEIGADYLSCRIWARWRDWTRATARWDPSSARAGYWRALDIGGSPESLPAPPS